jgi:hypothetical protein
MSENEVVAPSAGRWLRFSAWLGRIWRALIDLFAPPEPEPEPPSFVEPPLLRRRPRRPVSTVGGT